MGSGVDNAGIMSGIMSGIPEFCEAEAAAGPGVPALAQPLRSHPPRVLKWN